MLYRALDSIRFEDGRYLGRDKVSALKGIRPNAIKFLVGVGVLVPVYTPPLNVLRGWERRAAVLAEYGVLDASDLITADLGSLSEKTGISQELLEKCVGEVLEILDIKMED